MRQPLPSDAMTSFQLSRRAFLSRTAAGGAGLLLATTLPTRFAFGQMSNANGDLIIRQRYPLNGEPELEALIENYITPTKLFYIRNHGTIPKIDPANFKLKIEGLVDQPIEISLDELKQRFEKADGTATMTCAGNRRQEHGRFKKVGGVQWDAGAIGNATWGGVRLADVLKHCRPKEGAAHVWFDGADEVEAAGKKIHFGGSIPLDKAMQIPDSAPPALLAWEMNGEPLTPEHGHPLRSVVPGYIGARSVKWLDRIVVSDRPSPNHYVATAYKLVVEDTPLAVAEVAPIYRYPLNVAICDFDASDDRDRVTVRGYALPSGYVTTRIEKVEVSTDGGRRWTTAKLIDDQLPYCWTRWEAEVPLRNRATQLIVRGTDTAGEMTPDRVNWNAHGYLYNGWHAVPLNGNE